MADVAKRRDEGLVRIAERLDVAPCDPDEAFIALITTEGVAYSLADLMDAFLDRLGAASDE